MNFRRWFGIRNDHAVKTTGTHPVVDGQVVPFDVWLQPHAAPWEYVPMDGLDGPYRLVSTKVGGAMTAYGEFDTFLEVVELFSKFHMPRHQEVCTVVDIHCNVLLGWVNNEAGTWWAGCRHGFAMLGCYLPAEAAIAESLALGNSVLEIGEMFHHDLD